LKRGGVEVGFRVRIGISGKRVEVGFRDSIGFSIGISGKRGGVEVGFGISNGFSIGISGKRVGVKGSGTGLQAEVCLCQSE
jgi:hypothetical protein